MAPFPVGLLPPSLAFNPNVNNLRVAVNGPNLVAFPGSQSNVTTGINGNFLTGNSSTFEGSIGTWTGAGSSNLSVSSAFAHSGNSCLSINCLGIGLTAIASVIAANLLSSGMRVNAGDEIFVGAWIAASQVSRLCKIGVQFYDNTATQIGAVLFGNTVADIPFSWQFMFNTAVAPAAAYTMRINIQVQGANTSPGEVHFLDDVVQYNVTQNQSGLAQVFQTAFPQQPFSPQLPQFLQANPAFSGLRQQYSTALPNVFVPGSTSNVNVSGLSGIAVNSVNGSATSVAVSGQSDNLISSAVSGNQTNVAVNASSGAITESVISSTGLVSSSAISGTVNTVFPPTIVAGVPATVASSASPGGLKYINNVIWWRVYRGYGQSPTW